MVDGGEGGRRHERHWQTDLDGVLRPEWGRDLPPGPAGRGAWDGPWDDEPYRAAGLVGVGDLLTSRTDLVTRIVLVGDRLVDVVRTSARGSEYECAALEIEDEVRRRSVPVPPPAPEPPGHELQLAWLATIVGGTDALGRLDAEPLPPEPLSLDAVPPRLHVRAGALAERLEGPARALLGTEGPTACHRFLAALLRDAPGVLGRSDRDDTTAGAVLWAVARGNDLVGAGRPVPSKAVQEVMGLASSPASRGGSLAHALAGARPAFGPGGYYRRQHPDVIPLGSPSLLLGSFRRRLLVQRDIALALRENHRAS